MDKLIDKLNRLGYDIINQPVELSRLEQQIEAKDIFHEDTVNVSQSSDVEENVQTRSINFIKSIPSHKWNIMEFSGEVYLPVLSLKVLEISVK